MLTTVLFFASLFVLTTRPGQAATSFALKKHSSNTSHVVAKVRARSQLQRRQWRGGGWGGGGWKGGRGGAAAVTIVTEEVNTDTDTETVTTLQANQHVAVDGEVSTDTETSTVAEEGNGRGWRGWRNQGGSEETDQVTESDFSTSSTDDSWSMELSTTSDEPVITSRTANFDTISTSSNRGGLSQTSARTSNEPSTSNVISTSSYASTDPITSSQSSSTATSSTASSAPAPIDGAKVSLNSKDSEGITYTVEMNINGQTFDVIADTGSSMLWIPAAGCSTCSGAGMTVSGIDLPDGCSEWEQKYGLGSAVGCMTNSSVALGDLKLDSFSLLGVKSVDSILAQQGEFMSGILGFALDSGTYNDSPTFISQLYANGLITSPEVGFYLPRGANMDGVVTMGSATSPNADASSGVTMKMEPNDLSVYQIKMDSFELAGANIASAQSVVIDTGTTNIYIPSNLMADVVSELQTAGSNISISSGDLVVACSLDVSMSMTFGGKQFAIRREDIIGPAATDDPTLCLARLSDSGGDGLWIIGDAFLHNVYSVFNLQSGDVSFYPLV